MIRITQIKLPIGHGEEALENAVCRALHVRPSRIETYSVARRAVDARQKGDLKYVYTVHAALKNEDTYSVGGHNNIMFIDPVTYEFPARTGRPLSIRPVVVGSGPAGLFAALFLAENGFAPLIVERGADADRRAEAVTSFWEGGRLDPETNVQFGEGGAGTFSDGKLNTGISDRSGRVTEVLKTFRRFGGPEEILYDAAPHLGTDMLRGIVKNIRNRIIECGGSCLFHTCISDLVIRNGALRALLTADGRRIDAKLCILAPGHSARDTFLMLKMRGVRMSPKPFSAGVRVIHPQQMINDAQWGPGAPAVLGAAPYKLSARTPDGRGVYSFCMCPGGYVVNASSENGMTAVNGMSYSDRASGFANSAIVSGVAPSDYAPYANEIFSGELSGIAFQQRLEALAYRAGAGAIPAQEYADFKNRTKRAGGPVPAVKGAVSFVDLSSVLPDHIYGNILTGMEHFGRILPGFDAPDVPLFGVESRTSSPVRLCRDANLESNINGLFPCGEGAGYAGGITSAAVDGIRAAERCAAEVLKMSSIQTRPFMV